ncbi:MAG: putative bifunctional diguanylate cyclase/phosphodiesterase [Acidimicrobiales bacterium]
MDQWERRLHLVDRATAASVPAPARTHRFDGDGDPGEPATDTGVAGPTGRDDDPSRLVHPDEALVLGQLVDLAARRPGFRAVLPLLARAPSGSGWERRAFEITHEVMGPVVRPVEVAELGADGSSGVGTGHQRGVVDRGALVVHLAEALERAGDHLVAVLVVDLDRFKLHNDLLGAVAGDELLAMMAERVRVAAGRSYSAALGGDEFVVVVEHIDDPSRAKALAERVRQTIAEPVEIEGESVALTATVGLAVGGAGTVPDHLLRDADTALFAGKDKGRDRAQVFGRALEAGVARRLSTAHQLRHALAAGTLEMHYQPVLSLDTGVVVAAEALMRVAGSAAQQPLSPAHLVDAAEDSGLIARLGRYLLEETASQIAVWEPRLGRRRPFRVMVNVSPVQLSDRDFSNAIGHALGAARVAPDRLSLELTESVLLAASPTVDLVVQDLVTLGIAFGLDDFGADGSSLGGLRRFPIEFIKIDRELVGAVDRDGKVEAIVESTVTMARRLGVSTVAVGVETESQRDLLRSLGCDAAQGYLFSPPLTPDAFAELL